MSEVPQGLFKAKIYPLALNSFKVQTDIFAFKSVKKCNSTGNISAGSIQHCLAGWVTHYPHMPVGMLGIYRLLHVCNFVRSIFCKGYLQHGMTQGDEIWQDGRMGSRSSPLLVKGQKAKNFDNAHLVDDLHD